MTLTLTLFSGRVRPQQGTEICNLGEPSPLDFFLYCPVDFPFLQVFCVVYLLRKSPQNVEKIARIPGGEKSVKSCHVSGCHGVLRSRSLILRIRSVMQPLCRVGDQLSTSFQSHLCNGKSCSRPIVRAAPLQNEIAPEKSLI